MIIPSARKVTNTGTTKIIGVFYSAKMRVHVETESTLEADYLLHLEFSPDVFAYRTQPRTFVYEELLERSRRYTPDVAVVGTAESAPLYMEVKPAAIAASARFQRDFEWQCEAVRREGGTLSVVTDAFIRQEPRLTNLKQLYRYAALPLLREWEVGRLREICQAVPHTLDELKAAVAPFDLGLPHIYKAVSQGLLAIDLDVPLSGSSSFAWKEAHHES